MDHSNQEKDSEPDVESLQTSAHVQYAAPPPEGYAKGIPSGVEWTSGMVPETTGWDVYNNEAKKVDSELVKDWTASLNFLLVFAAIFSAVLSAFIIESKKLLEPDPASIMVDVLIFYTNNAANGTHSPYYREEFHPTAEAVSINCLLFGSLSFSIVAALGSVLALQWVADYDAAITRGGSSPEDRGIRRQFRFGGITKWRMGGVIAALPLLLHFSVLLFFVGVIQWVSTLNSTVGYVLVAGGATAVFFYLSTTLLAVAFTSAPFNTPISRSMESLLQLPTLLRHLYSRLSSRLLSNPKLNSKIWDQPGRIECIIAGLRTQLASQAFVWVGSVIYISPESHQRYFLLLDSILRSTSAINWSAIVLSAPWIRFLDILGRKHLSESSRTTVTQEDIYQVSILMKVFEHELIKAQLTPSKHVGKEDPSINGIFLLLDDLPPPAAVGMRNVILLSRWRHSGNLEVWDAIIDCYYKVYQDAYLERPNMAEECLTTLVHHFCESISRLKEDRNPKIERIIERFADVPPRNNVTFGAARILAQLFESRVTGEEIGNPPPGIFANLERYANRVGTVEPTNDDLSSTKLRLHYKLLKLLAQTLHLTPQEDQDRYLREIVMKLWSSPAGPYSKSWKEECISGVPRAANQQPGKTIIDPLGCLNFLVPVLRRLAIDLREMIRPSVDFDYPERPFTIDHVERVITSIHSELNYLGFETSDLGRCKAATWHQESLHKDEPAAPSYISLIEFICKGVGFIIENNDTLKDEYMWDKYLQDENRHGHHYTFYGPSSSRLTSPEVMEMLYARSHKSKGFTQ